MTLMEYHRGGSVMASQSGSPWTKCAYCGAPAGGVDPCCTDCRRDIHAHCPSWPSCTRLDYGRPCNATREEVRDAVR